MCPTGAILPPVRPRCQRRREPMSCTTSAKRLRWRPLSRQRTDDRPTRAPTRPTSIGNAIALWSPFHAFVRCRAWRTAIHWASVFRSEALNPLSAPAGVVGLGPDLLGPDLGSFELFGDALAVGLIKLALPASQSSAGQSLADRLVDECALVVELVEFPRQIRVDH